MNIKGKHKVRRLMNAYNQEQQQKVAEQESFVDDLDS